MFDEAYQSCRTVVQQRAARKVASVLRQSRLRGDTGLISERELAKQVGVSRPTLRLVLRKLERHGVIRRIGGKRQAGIAPGEAANQPFLFDTVAILSAIPTPKAPPADPRRRGWYRYIQAGAAAAIEAAKCHCLTVNPGVAREQAESLIAGRPRGVILFAPVVSTDSGRELLEMLRTGGAPFVVPGLPEEFPEFDTVGTDHESGAYDLTRWLLSQGRHRILRLRDRGLAEQAWLVRRDVGHERAMREAGLELLPPLEPAFPRATEAAHDYFQASAHLAAGYLAEYLRAQPGVDAIMAASDGPAFSCAAACRMLGLEPGRDVLVVGFDDYWYDCVERQWEASVPAATVNKLNTRIGEELVKLLLDRAAGRLPGGPQHRLVKPELAVTSQEEPNGRQGG